jgi:hypothetical protein
MALLSSGADVNAQGGDYGNALAYRNQGRRKEAEELQAQVLEIFSKVLGTEHPDTLKDELLELIFHQLSGDVIVRIDCFSDERYNRGAPCGGAVQRWWRRT